MDNQSNTIGLEILLHLCTVKGTDIDVCHGEAPTPFLVHICELRVLDIENAVKEREIIGDFLIALDMEASARFRYSCGKIRHFFFFREIKQQNKRATKAVEAEKDLGSGVER